MHQCMLRICSIKQRRKVGELLTKFYEENQEQLKPWLDMSHWAIDTLRTGMESGDFDQPPWMGEEGLREVFKTTPGYEFRQREAQKMMRRAYNSGQYGGSGVGGGEHMKAAARYAGNIASQEFGNSYNRALTDYQQNLENQRLEYNRMASLAQIGQVGPQTQVGLNQQYTQGVNNLAMQGANAMGAGAINAANAGVMGQHAANQVAVSNFNRSMALMGVGAAAGGPVGAAIGWGLGQIF